MTTSRGRAGTIGWIGLAAYVIAFDVWAKATGRETLTAAFARGIRHPRARWPVMASWFAVTTHLFGGVP